MIKARRAHLSVAFALLLAAAPLTGFAQTTDEKPESVRPETDKPSNSAPGVVVEDVPAEPVEGPIDTPVKRTPKSVIIDQNPPNPRCYVGGRYVPAPPLCPN
jgi:hypothetical protein